MSDGEHGRAAPRWARPQFVADLAACVGEWDERLRGPQLLRDAGFASLLQRSAELDARSQGVGFGGAGRHLAELVRLAQASPDVHLARQQLDVVRDLLRHARGSLDAAEAAWQPGQLAPGTPALLASAAGVAPPRMLSTFLPAEGGPSSSLSPPPLLTHSSVRPAAAPLALQLGAPPGALPAPQQPHSVVPAAPSRPGQARPGQPNLLVRSVLGLRAFGGKAKSAKSDPPPPRPGGVLGLERRAPIEPAPPPALGGGYGGLPMLNREHSSTPAPAAREPSGRTPSLGRGPQALRETPGNRLRETPAARLRETPGNRARQPDTAQRGGRARRRPDQGENRWWVGVMAALGVSAVVAGIVITAVVLTRRKDTAADSGVPTGSASAGAGLPLEPQTTPSPPSSLPRSRLLTDDERFRSLLSQVHGRGKESAELRALLEEQASLAAQALQPGCQGPECAALAEVGKLVTTTTKKRVQRRSRSPDALRSKWLAGLEMPEIPVEDDPRVQRRFEFYTENPLGRETFQQMLFRCGAFKDSIQSSLIRHGMPKDLIAVVFQESGCAPLAKSPMGAEGLWQFIPDAARAYHLRIIPDVVDERHSPQKSTEAAITYLSDMYAKLSSWDLVFAAYNMGPFGLMSRLERVEGEGVGFWELVDAEMLPAETADYAPAIEAIALILNNLQRLKFLGTQMRAPQMTMDLTVPPATRLTLVARAAALSLDDLRRLNLDIKGMSTPNVPNFAVQVPKDSVWQARETLEELLKTRDSSDQCAPSNFDWGRQRFTPEMAQACARAQGVAAATSAAARTSDPPPAQP